MSKKVLLLNNNFEIISFVSERKAIKLFIKGNKVDVISTWPGIEIHYGAGSFILPATLKLKYFIRKNYTQLNFSRKAVFKRDNLSCQYCGKCLKYSQATIDHIVPKSLGGQSTFTNCVTSCIACNNKKGNKMPEQVDMFLQSKPIAPARYMHFISDQDAWHDDWNLFSADRNK